MSTPTIPHVRLMDPDDLDLSCLEEENEASLDSLEHLEAIDALLPHTKDEEKQSSSSDGNGKKAVIWMIANVLASIAIVRFIVEHDLSYNDLC